MRPKFIPGQRVIVRSGLPHLVGQTGTIHCDPEYDLNSLGVPRFVGWWYHVVFDYKAIELPGTRWWCTESALDPYEEPKPSWRTIELLTGWRPPSKEKT